MTLQNSLPLWASVAARSVLFPALIVALAGISVGSFWLALQENDVSSVEITPALHSFGHVQQGETLKLDVTLRNNTDRKFVLGQPFGSCRCATTSDLRGRVLAPHDEIVVPVKWDISGRRNLANADMAFEFEAPSSDGGRSRLVRVFRATAYVEPEYDVSPVKLFFLHNKPAEFTVSCMRNTSSNFRLKPRVIDFGSNHPAIKVRAAHPAKKAVDEVIVSFEPALWDGDIRIGNELQVQLMTNSEYEPLFVIPVEVKQNTGSS